MIPACRIAVCLVSLGLTLPIAVHAQGAPPAAKAPAAADLNTLTAAERRDGWRLLFDGKTTKGWRGYREKAAPAGWQVVDGALARVDKAGNLSTEEQFGNFELALEWKIGEGGNSGVMYRVTEAHEEPYETGPEMQVLDDARHADGKSLLTSAGSDFGLYATKPGIAKPAGTWNAARIVVKGNRVEHWLNGTKVVEYELGSADWKDRVAKSKFGKWPDYGLATRGYIVLQDHGDAVAYRNIRIRTLP